VFSFLIPDGPNGILKLNLVDGADWDVQTFIQAQLIATPLPPALGMFMAGVAGIGWLARKRKQKQLPA
jgi:LPXTG-motif cell wall-anchored protein